MFGWDVERGLEFRILVESLRTMVKVEDVAEHTQAPAPSNDETRSGKPPMRIFIYFVVAVIVAMALQKAIPAMDVALSCHAKVVCSGIFVSHRTFEHVDISKVSSQPYPILCLFTTLTLSLTSFPWICVTSLSDSFLGPQECSPIVKYITSATVNMTTSEVTSSLFGLLYQRAKYNGNYRGCSLVGKEPLTPEPLRKPKKLENPSLPWPQGNTVDLTIDEDTSELALTLDLAFSRFKPLVPGSSSPTSNVTEATEWGTREFVVVQNGRIVYEYYAPGFTPKTALLGWSMSKTLMASLIGIRIGEGAMDVQAKVARWLPDWRSNNRSQVTIDDLLTMQSGLQWIEGYSLSHGEVIPMLFNDESCSERPRRAEPTYIPGKQFSYASGTSNLLSEVLRASIKYDEAYWTYPARMLFEPIGADSLVLETDRIGTFNAAAFGYGAARDWARVGLLFLRDGVWVDGKRILPEGWVEYVTAPRKSSHGIYGAHFWLGGTEVDPKDIDYDPHLQEHAQSSVLLPKGVFTMTGFAGQFVSVIPDKNAVIVRLSRDPSKRAYGELISEIIKVLP